MFSTLSRKLKGNLKQAEYVQLFTPNDFDNFLRNDVFEGGVTVLRVHAVSDISALFASSRNPHTRGIGHGGWRPGQILANQAPQALARLQTSNPAEYARLMSSNSLVLQDATASDLLEQFDVLKAMCRGHDGKNPNHVLRFVLNPVTKRAEVQYKHFCFEDEWRPKLRFDPSMQEWVPDNNVRYSWLKEDADLDYLATAIPGVKIGSKAVAQSVIDNLAKCSTSLANWTESTMQDWTTYFKSIEDIRQAPQATIPFVTPRAMAAMFAPAKHSTIQHAKSISELRLTSVALTEGRETLVARGLPEQVAWTEDMTGMRETPRVQRIPTLTQNSGQTSQSRIHQNNPFLRLLKYH